LVLVVDDEQDLLRILEYNLQRSGFSTRGALTGEAALRLARQSPHPDLVVLDLMLPDIPGEEVCRRIRADAQLKDVPILMLTAKGEEIARVVGFEVGADDYVVKPFSVRELMLRVKAILRRSDSEPGAGGVVRFGVLEIDREAYEVRVNKQPVALSSLEFRLLVRLMNTAGRVQSRDSLLDAVWNVYAEVMPRTVDVHVKRLREKLGEAGAYIETVRGVGYRFPASVDEK
jgi:two-component system phosphate regulon response regulator PhoB